METLPSDSETHRLPEEPEDNPAITMLGSAAVNEVTLSKDERILYDQDWSQIQEVRSDAQKFNDLFEQYEWIIHSFASKYYISGGEYEDVLQEGAIGLYKAVRDYDGRSSSFRSFAELCVKRQVITAVISARRQKHSFLNTYISLYSSPNREEESGRVLAEYILDKRPGPEEITISRESIALLVDTIRNELSWLEYSCLKMYMEGEAYETIAQDLAVHTKTVDNALQRIKRKVLDLVEC